jgi:hyperosmotically inducible periplasmic protein
MKRLYPLGVAALSLALGASSLAAQSGKSQTTNKSQDQKSNTTLQTSRGSDRGSEWLHKEVRHELVMLPYLSVFDNLSYRIDGDKVTLMGQVARPSLKPDAENVVKRVEGVASVDNQIEILPNSPNDDRLRLALYREIFSDSGLFRYGMQVVPPVHIIVKNGHVMLEGVVANETEKNIAGIKANGVSGVFSVKNNLQVEGQK